MPFSDLSFPIGSSDPLGEIAWSKLAHIETQQMLFFAKAGMTAKAKGGQDTFKRKSGAPVILYDELGGNAGSEVRVPLRKQLTRTPRTTTYGTYTYGDTSMLGNEEALVYHDLAVPLGLLKHAVGHNSPDFYYHYTSMNLEEDTEDALKEWLVENHEEAILDCGYEQIPYFIQQQLSESAVAHPRTYYAGNVSSQAEMSETSILDAREAMNLRAYANDRKLNPIRIDGGDHFAVLADSYVLMDLRQDEMFRELKDAAPRGADNPIVSGSIGVFQNLCFHEYERMRVMTSGAQAANIGRVLLLGADAIAVAYGSRPRIVPRVESSYGDRWGRAIRQVFGAKRADFQNVANTATTQQSSVEWRVWRTAAQFAA